MATSLLTNVVDVVLQSIDALDLLLDGDDQIAGQQPLFPGLNNCSLDRLAQLAVSDGMTRPNRASDNCRLLNTLQLSESVRQGDNLRPL